MSAAASQ
ncbi:hypothetical protein HaLaN_32347, partial [Haematococcus lacustris]